MNTDFEGRLAELLNESVDARLGTRHAAPPFEAPPIGAEHEDELTAHRRRRFTFLAVAATVAAILVGALGVHVLAPGTRHHPPAGSTPPSPPAPKPAPNDLGGAMIVLPHDWVIRPYSEYLPKGAGTGYSQAWCLTPSSTPASTAQNACPVTFATVAGRDAALDPDEQGGLPGDAEYCFQGHQVASDHGHGDIRDFGDRPAFFYREDIRCTTRTSTHYAQYVVVGLPAYVLYTATPTSAIRSAMQTIAQKSTLPAQSSSLLLADLGRVTAMTGSGSAVRLTLNRVYPDNQTTDQRFVAIPGQRVSYMVTSAQLHTGASDGPIRKGSVVKIQTNGSTVTDVFGEYEKK